MNNKSEFYKSIIILLVIVANVLMLYRCTNNPVDESSITTRSKQIHGRVSLGLETNHEGIYVWLEGYNMGTFTDQTGRFDLELPYEGSHPVGIGNNAMLNLYLYVANYQISTADVITVDGEFLLSRGDIGAHGELTGDRTLLKLLNINTLIDPDTVLVNEDREVIVQVHLQATFDSVTVVFPKIIGNTGIVLLKNLNSGNAYVYLPEAFDNTQTSERLGPEVRIWSFVFGIKQGDLPPGTYEVVPYFFIEQENLPAELLESLDPNFGTIGAGFLNIPFKRSGGHIFVRGEL